MTPHDQTTTTADLEGRRWFFSPARGVLVIGLTLALAACQSSPSRVSDENITSARSPADTPSTVELLRKVAGRPPEPVSMDAVRTTDGAIFLTNVNAQVETLRQRAETTNAARWKQQYASRLYFRARLVGDVTDFDRAQAIVDELLTTAPDDVTTQLLAARLDSAMHRFDASKAHLDRARSLGAYPTALLEAESQLALALGQVDAALELARQQEAAANDLTTLAYLGNLAVLQGNLPKAERLFSRAELRFEGTGPFLLSWLHTQHGIALLRNGQIERANRYFLAAHKRLPGYFLATEHLAETELLLGNAAEALRLYEQVIEQTGNPEFLGALADTRMALGQNAEAALTLQRAHRAWQQMIAKHPQASWQHAAEFYLEQGSDAPQALHLARMNIALRQDVSSWLLLARAEQAAGELRQACAALDQAQQSGLNPPELRDAEQELGEGCAKTVAMQVEPRGG